MIDAFNSKKKLTQSSLMIHRLRNELYSLESHPLVQGIFLHAENSWCVKLAIPESKLVKETEARSRTVADIHKALSRVDNVLELSPAKPRAMMNKNGYLSLDCEISAAYDWEIKFSPSNKNEVWYNQRQSGAAWMGDFDFVEPILNEQSKWPAIWRSNSDHFDDGPTLLINFPNNYPFCSPDVSICIDGNENFSVCELLYWTPACKVLDILTAVVGFLDTLK